MKKNKGASIQIEAALSRLAVGRSDRVPRRRFLARVCGLLSLVLRQLTENFCSLLNGAIVELFGQSLQERAQTRLFG